MSQLNIDLDVVLPFESRNRLPIRVVMRASKCDKNQIGAFRRFLTDGNQQNGRNDGHDEQPKWRLAVREIVDHGPLMGKNPRQGNTNFLNIAMHTSQKGPVEALHRERMRAIRTAP